MSIRFAYGTTVPFGFKWVLAHRRRHDTDMFKTGRHDARMTRHAVFCPSVVNISYGCMICGTEGAWAWQCRVALFGHSILCGCKRRVIQESTFI